MKNITYYPNISTFKEETLEPELSKHTELGFEPKGLTTGSGEKNLIKNEIERLRIAGSSFKGMFVVIDNEGFPMFATVSLNEETAIQRMVNMGPGMQWQYYLDKGHTVEKVTINVKKEK